MCALKSGEAVAVTRREVYTNSLSLKRSELLLRRKVHVHLNIWEVYTQNIMCAGG